MSQKASQYQCSMCTKVRDIMLDVETHETRVAESPNGIVILSDIHRCKNGILGINNLQIDHNFHTRSVESLGLPERRATPKHGIPGLPSPVPVSPKENNNLSQIIITEMLPEKGFRIAIDDKQLGVIVNIGNIDIKGEMAISVISSDHGTIIINYYPSEMIYNSHIEKWLVELANLLEILPPTTLGLFIETLRFIHTLHQTPYDEFYLTQLKTILSSHETYFMLVEDDDIPIGDKLKAIKAKYGDETVEIMSNLISYLEENPMVTLQVYAGLHHRDLIYLINAFLIMEQENILSIERPGIVTDTVKPLPNLAKWMSENK